MYQVVSRKRVVAEYADVETAREKLVTVNNRKAYINYDDASVIKHVESMPKVESVLYDIQDKEGYSYGTVMKYEHAGKWRYEVNVDDGYFDTPDYYEAVQYIAARIGTNEFEIV